MERMIFSCIESRIHNANKCSCYSRFHIGSLSRDQAITYSNMIRRFLLADNHNISIVAISFLDAEHEYSLIQGIKESILDILLNLKQVVFVNLYNNVKNRLVSNFAYLHNSGPMIIKANDIILPKSLSCFNKYQYLATLSQDGRLIAKMKLVDKSMQSTLFLQTIQFESILAHYTRQLFKDNKFPIILDSNFSCVIKVNYKINTTDELEQYSNLIILEVWTNGGLSPRTILQESLKEATTLLSSFYNSSVSTKLLENSTEMLEEYLGSLVNKSNLFKKKFFNQYPAISSYNVVFSNSYYNKSLIIDDIDISLQTKFLLKRKGLINVKDLLRIKKKVFMQFYNLSLKSIKEIRKKISINSSSIFDKMD